MNQTNQEQTAITAYKIGILALLISVICLVFSYLGIGYTTNDETGIEILAYSPLITTVLQGRLHLFASYYLAIFPHWISKVSGFNLFNLINLLAITSSVIWFSLAIYKATQQKLFAILIAMFFLVAIQNSWEHNVLTSYTFQMNVSISFLLVSLNLFIAYLRSNNILLWILSSLVFLLTLFLSYEFFFMYIAVFVFLAAFYNEQVNITLKRYLLTTFYSSSLHLIATIVFVALYFIVKYFYSLSYNYHGVLVTQPFSYEFFSNALRVICQYTVSSFPTYIYFHYSNLFDTYSELTQGHSYTIYNLLTQMKAEWLLKSIMVSYFVYMVLQHRLIIISNRMFTGLSIIAIYVMLVPNILVSITDKYQNWILNGSLAYTTTYYSYFGTVLLLVSGIVFLNQIFNNNTILLKILKQCYIWFITITIAFMSFATDYSNYYVFKEQKISQQKWVVLDTFVQSGNLDSVPDGSFIYAPSLFNARGIVANFSNYWTDYINLKYKKAVIVSNSVEELKARLAQQKFNNLYYLKLSQEPKDMHQFILFSKVKTVINDNIFLSSDAVIVSNSNRKKFLIFGRNLPVNIDTLTLPVTNVAVLIDNELAQRDGNFFSKSIDKQQIKNHYTSTHLKTVGDAVLDLESISISSYVDHKLYKIDHTDCFQPDIVFHLGQGSTLPCELNYILPTGWYGLEPWGTWSTANAEMQIDLPKDCQGNDECELKLNLGYGVFNAATAKPKQVTVKINNKLIKDWIFNSWGVGDYSMNIPLDAKILQEQTKNIKIQFHIPAAESPKQIGMSEDARILGMGLSAYQLIKRNAN